MAGFEVIDISQVAAEDMAQVSGSVSQSNRQSQIQPGRQMMSIKSDKLPLLESLCQKVERNYCVEIRIDTEGAGDSATDVLWILILGSKGDCKDASVRIFLLNDNYDLKDMDIVFVICVLAALHVELCTTKCHIVVLIRYLHSAREHKLISLF